MGSNEGAKQAGKQQKDKQQAKKSPHTQGVLQLFFQSRQGIRQETCQNMEMFT